MKKYNLTVMVTKDSEPICYLYNNTYEKTKYIGMFCVDGMLEHLFPTLEWALEEGQEGDDYIVYASSPVWGDDDVKIVAVWDIFKG